MTKTKVIKVNPKAVDQRAIAEAIEVLERDGLVAFPTETVYGIAANLLSKQAQDRLKELKSRPDDKRFTIHIANQEEVVKFAVDILARAYKLIEKFWPGPLTLVLKAANDNSVGLRMPNNNVALRLLSSVDFPVVAPSANLSGRCAPKDAGTVLKELEGSIELILDGGPTELGVSSTVVDARELPFKVLRKGAIKEEEVLKVSSQKVVFFVCTGNSCRSVMAEYLLKKRLKDSNREDVDVHSLGTFSFFGMPPTKETLSLVSGELGMDASSHRAQKVNWKALRTADLILVMERRHKDEILRQFPQLKDRIYLLGDFINLDPKIAEIEDPIGRSQEVYRSVFFKIKSAIERLEI